MAKTVIAVLQSIWDCRWSRLAPFQSNSAVAAEYDARWVCVRRGDHRPVCEEECADCPHWQEHVRERTN